MKSVFEFDRPAPVVGVHCERIFSSTDGLERLVFFAVCGCRLYAFIGTSLESLFQRQGEACRAVFEVPRESPYGDLQVDDACVGPPGTKSPLLDDGGRSSCCQDPAYHRRGRICRLCSGGSTWADCLSCHHQGLASFRCREPGNLVASRSHTATALDGPDKVPRQLSTFWIVDACIYLHTCVHPCMYTYTNLQTNRSVGKYLACKPATT